MTESTGLLSNNDSSQPAHQVMDRKFEIVELCGMFLGDRGSSIYIFTLGLYMYGTLWAYTR